MSRQAAILLLVTLPLMPAEIGLRAEKRGSSLRERFYAASDDSSASERFYQELHSAQGDSDPVTKGYLAMSSLLMAKHSINPVNKLKHFRTGARLLDQAIDEAPGSFELRFLRFTAQDNAPWILGYHGNVEDDELMVRKLLREGPGRDRDLYERVTKYFAERDQ